MLQVVALNALHAVGAVDASPTGPVEFRAEFALESAHILIFPHRAIQAEFRVLVDVPCLGPHQQVVAVVAEVARVGLGIQGEVVSQAVSTARFIHYEQDLLVPTISRSAAITRNLGRPQDPRACVDGRGCLGGSLHPKCSPVGSIVATHNQSSRGGVKIEIQAAIVRLGPNLCAIKQIVIEGA